jgi:hypothetical protein
MVVPAGPGLQANRLRQSTEMHLPIINPCANFFALDMKTNYRQKLQKQDVKRPGYKVDIPMDRAPA